MNRIYLKGSVIPGAQYTSADVGVLKFTMAVKERYNHDLNKYLYRLVPCVLLGPNRGLIKRLTDPSQVVEIACEGIYSDIRHSRGQKPKKDPSFLIDPGSLDVTAQ